MELQRTEYPAMMKSLHPTQAIKVLNDRLHYIKTVNTDVAEWLQERKRIEEQYAIALRKLAARPLSQNQEKLDMGVFDTPWTKIVNSTDTISNSHHAFARAIENEVEKPLRSFATTNREISNMESILGNINALAKDVDNANKKAEKLNSKGGKADAQKVANAVSTVEDAEGQWDSQAPYVFERLQEVDELRLELLQKCLTQFQTYADETRNSTSASVEECLNALLNVQLADEIVLFSQKVRQGGPTVRERRMSRPQQPNFAESSSLAPPPIPSQHDAASIRSGSFQDTSQPEGKVSRLKRFSTVLKGRRHSTHPYGQPLQSPENKRSSTNVASKFPSFTKKQRDGTDTLSPQSTGNRQNLEPRPSNDRRTSDISASRSLERVISTQSNNAIPEASPERSPAKNLTNGNHLPAIPVAADPATALFDPNEIMTPHLPAVAEKSEREAPGPPMAPLTPSATSVPLGGSDAINQAMSEAAAVSDGGAQGQFKVDIRNAPIQEEDADASAALASVATALRSQATPRRNPTLRGRRDRNTIIVPNSSAPELPVSSVASTSQSSLPGSSHSPANIVTSPVAIASSVASPVTATPVAQQTTPPPQSAPFKPTSRSTLVADETSASDTHSIRSGRSLSSTVSNTIRHPEMHVNGLNASIVETVSAWFEAGTCTRAMQIGELALVYNSEDTEPTGNDTIRFEHFDSLEKVAPNPIFIDSIAGKTGTYNVHLSHIVRTQIAFKYQIHLDSDEASSFAPLKLIPAWKVEANQTLVMLSYSFNPAFAAKIPDGVISVTLSNVILIVHLDPGGGKILRCQAQGGGTYSRERNLVYWRLNEITLQRDGSAQALRARFFTDGQASPGNAEARWELSGDQILTLGSGIGLSRLEGPDNAFETTADDPFADEGGAVTPTSTWKEVEIVRRLRSGTYVGSS